MAVPIVTICVGTQLPTAIQVQNSVIVVIIEHPLECLNNETMQHTSGILDATGSVVGA